MRGLAQYATTNSVGASAQEEELLAFSIVTSHLANATSEDERIRALYRNQQLWSCVLNDVALSTNLLPQTLKDDITCVGLWAMRYSTLAIPQRLPVAPLIEINRNIMDGLRDQIANLKKLPPPSLQRAAGQAVAV